MDLSLNPDDGEARFAAYVATLGKALGHADRVAPFRSYWDHDKSSSQVSGISEHRGNDIGRRVFSSAIRSRLMRLRRHL